MWQIWSFCIHNSCQCHSRKKHNLIGKSTISHQILLLQTWLRKYAWAVQINMHVCKVTQKLVNIIFVYHTWDELTKNNEGDCRGSHTAVMPEKPGDESCPVASYLKYVSHLHPDCDALWAWPLPRQIASSVDSNSAVWYSRVPIGKTILSKFMNDLDAKYKLLQSYTNHSIRVTDATIFLLGVTGLLVAWYQGEKIQVGQSLGQVECTVTINVHNPNKCNSRNLRTV